MSEATMELRAQIRVLHIRVQETEQLTESLRTGIRAREEMLKHLEQTENTNTTCRGQYERAELVQ